MPTLYGYYYSVYTRVVRFALAEKGVSYSYVEIDPFDAKMDLSYLAIHPFQKVPALINDGFAIYETSAITRYIDEKFIGHTLQPEDANSRAKMTQVIAIVDAYGYWPMIRQVFSNRVFTPESGEEGDEIEVEAGLIKSKKVLNALENIVSKNTYLCGPNISLADIHLAPMMDYFQQAAEGKCLLSEHYALATWWETIKEHPNFILTQPLFSKRSD